MSGTRAATVRLWRETVGRDGVWCSACRHATPVDLLLLRPTGAVLRCERCARPLTTGPRAVPTTRPDLLGRCARRSPRATPAVSPTADLEESR